MRWSVRVVVGILGGLVAGALLTFAVASAVGASRFRARYEMEKAELLGRGRAAAPIAAAAPPPGGLPAPVRRYLDAASAFARPRLRVATVRQRGTIRTAADKPWMPFEAEQAYSIDPPAFVWLATARVAPFTTILARDAFVDGRGSMRIRLLGVVNVADATGPEMDRGAALRYWGEIIAFPEVVRGPHLRWEPMDEQHARLLIEQGDLAMTAVVEFGPEGFPAAMHAQRYRDAGGKQVLTPWSGRSTEWSAMGGRLFPRRWESVWHLAEGDFVAVRMEVLDVAVE